MAGRGRVERGNLGQVELGFERAITAEDLEELIAERLAETEAHELAHPDEPDPGQDRPPLVLLAMSDNGPQMRSDSTAEYMAAVAFGQHFGRPGTPTDQAEIETSFGHNKHEYPHLTQTEDPATLRTELKIVRALRTPGESATRIPGICDARR